MKISSPLHIASFRPNIRRALRAWIQSAACCALLLTAGSASAQTWKGTVNNSWSIGLNWDSTLPPANNGTANLIFTGTVRLNPNTDLAWNVNQIRYTNAGAFVNGGQPITIQAGGVKNEDDTAQTINNSIVLGAAQSWEAATGPLVFGGALNNNGKTLTVTGPAAVTLYGIISGTGGLTKSGSGALTLGGATANSYSGATVLNGGTTLLVKSGALGSSSVQLNTGATLSIRTLQTASSGVSLTMNGGVLQNNNRSATFGPLTVSGSSDIILSRGTAVLSFSAASRTAGTLKITNWVGYANQKARSFGNRILISSPPPASFLAAVQFSGFDPGATMVGNELVPLSGGPEFHQYYASRVPARFVGINAQDVAPLVNGFLDGDPENNGVRPHLENMVSVGIQTARADAAWNIIETNAPNPITHQHTYDWGQQDRWMKAVAIHEMYWMPILCFSTTWSTSKPGVTTAAPLKIYYPDFAAYSQAVAKRYGGNLDGSWKGDFWLANPTLPYRPVQTYEVWNEENFTNFWGGPPNAADYIDLFLGAYDAIKSIQPQAEVMVGGLAIDPALEDYIRQMYEHRPDAHGKIDSFGWHPYEPDYAAIFLGLTRMRRILDELGETNMPIACTETGWKTATTGGGMVPITEGERADSYWKLFDEILRTDCQVTMVCPLGWDSYSSKAEYYSIADHLVLTDGTYQATMRPSAYAIGDVIRFHSGQTTNKPPRRTLHHGGHAAPDADQDGWPDEMDEFPFDPTTHGDGAADPTPSETFFYTPRVDENFFGIEGDALRALPAPNPGFAGAPLIHAHLRTLKETGLRRVRVTAFWSNIEPARPDLVTGAHTYSWTVYDQWVNQLARAGLSWWAVLDNSEPPNWSGGTTPKDPAIFSAEFAAFAEAVAQRYGVNGDFWLEHPNLPYKPVTHYELWSRPNYDYKWWGNAASPAQYAQLYLAGRNAIRSIDSSALVFVGDLYDAVDSASAYSPTNFIAQLYAVPGVIGNVDGVTLGLVDNDTNVIKSRICEARIVLDAQNTVGTNLVHDVPLAVAEVLWVTQGTGGPPPITESQRAGNFSALASALAKADSAHIISFMPAAWWSYESEPANYFHWTGISNHESGPANGFPITLKESGAAYRDQILLFRGQRAGQPPPLDAIELCE